MILQSLVSYYEKMAEKGKILRPGYSLADVNYGLIISEAGKLCEIISLEEEKIVRVKEKGKTINNKTRTETKYEAKSMLVPTPVERRSNKTARYLRDNAEYLLGIVKKDKDGDNKKKIPGEAADINYISSQISNEKVIKKLPNHIQCFLKAKHFHLDLLKNVDTPAANAIKAFFANWNPFEAENNEVIAPYLKKLMKNVNIVFLDNNLDYLHDDPSLRKAWDNSREQIKTSTKMQCLVTGKIAPIARLHTSLKGLPGAKNDTAPLVSFNCKSFESYGREGDQGLNSPVSEYAMFAYTTVLNHMLADREHRQLLGGNTIVYWAENAEDEPVDILAAMSNTFFEPKPDTNKTLNDLIEKASKGIPFDFEGSKLDTKFYILGLAPNAARASVRFFHCNSFANILTNVLNHYKRLEIEGFAPKKASEIDEEDGDNEGKMSKKTKQKVEAEPEVKTEEQLIEEANENFFSLKPYWLLNETVSPNSKDKTPSPVLTGSVMSSIINDTMYPEALLGAVITRIKAGDKINRGKVAIIKAFLLKKYEKNNKYKEVLGMSLNENSEFESYDLGRLFALLEMAQERANDTNEKDEAGKTGGIKSSSIRARFFGSACTSPGSVFPTLLRSSTHHLIKLSKDEKTKGIGIWLDSNIGKIQDKFDGTPFPKHLTLEEQGLFIKGYYHQVQDKFKKRIKTEENINLTNESEEN